MLSFVDVELCVYTCLQKRKKNHANKQHNVFSHKKKANHFNFQESFCQYLARTVKGLQDKEIYMQIILPPREEQMFIPVL